MDFSKEYYRKNLENDMKEINFKLLSEGLGFHLEKNKKDPKKLILKEKETLTHKKEITYPFPKKSPQNPEIYKGNLNAFYKNQEKNRLKKEDTEKLDTPSKVVSATWAEEFSATLVDFIIIFIFGTIQLGSFYAFTVIFNNVNIFDFYFEVKFRVWWYFFLVGLIYFSFMDLSVEGTFGKKLVGIHINKSLLQDRGLFILNVKKYLILLVTIVLLGIPLFFGNLEKFTGLKLIRKS